MDNFEVIKNYIIEDLDKLSMDELCDIYKNIRFIITGMEKNKDERKL